jgi:hypothetical protein
MGDKVKKASRVNRFTGKVYVANFEGDEIDGKRYAYGDEIDESVDAGTVRYLYENGRLTELSEGDPIVPAIDSGSPLGLDAGLKAASTMTRAEMLSELSADMPDHELRRAVEARRQRAEGGDEDEAPQRGKGDTFEDLADANERAEAVKLMRQSETKLRKLAEDEEVEGVEADHDKADIVRAILAKRAQVAQDQTDEFDATAFVDRNLDEIEPELAGLSAEDRTAVREAENARSEPRSTLVAKLDELDKPAA